MSQFDSPITKKEKLKLWSVPKIEDSMERWSASSLVTRGGLWAKHMGLKWGAIGNILEEHIGNLGAYWEPDGKKGKRKKCPPPNFFFLKIKALWVHAEPLAAWNFYFQNCSSPFVAWANTPIINWGYLFCVIFSVAKSVFHYSLISKPF